MAQLWNLPLAGTDIAGDAVKTAIPNALETLRTLWAGASEPSETAAYQMIAHTTPGLLKIRDASDTSFVVPGFARHTAALRVGALSATQTVRLLASEKAFVVSRLVLISDTATTSSSGNEWQFGLRNVTGAVELFSGTVGTFTALGGVGGGAEMAIDTAYILTPDQNTSIAINDVIRLTLTKVGAATNLTDLTAILELYPKLV